MKVGKKIILNIRWVCSSPGEDRKLYLLILNLFIITPLLQNYNAIHNRLNDINLTNVLDTFTMIKIIIKSMSIIFYLK